MPVGQELAWWITIVSCLAFMTWWPWYQFHRYIKAHEPQEEECTRCGRMVESLDFHLRYCKGQIARRNPLRGNRSIITKTFKKGESIEKIGAKQKKPGELEDLFPDES